MVRTIVSLTILLMWVQSYAQTMVIHRSDGSSVRISVADIHKITFDLGTSNAQKQEIVKKVKTVFAKLLPNPFTTKIEYDVLTYSNVRVYVLDMQGQVIRTLQNQMTDIGHHSTSWNQCDANGRKVANGAYLVNVAIGGKSFSKTVFLVK